MMNDCALSIASGPACRIILEIEERVKPASLDISLELDIKLLATKLLQGDVLSDGERTALHILVKRKLHLKYGLSIGGLKGKIDSVRKNMLKLKGKIDEVQHLIQEVIPLNLDERLHRALAKLLLVYDEALLPDSIAFKMKQFKPFKNGEVVEKELIRFVDAYNMASPSNSRLAGLLALEIGGRRIFYTREGLLKLASPAKKMGRPLTLCNANDNVFIQIKQLEDIFLKVYDRTVYNNLSPMLEFMKFFRETKQSNPTLTLCQAFEAFDPFPSKIFDKYQSGDCVVIASKTQTVLRTMGIESSVVGCRMANIWSTPPIPGGERLGYWEEYDRVSEGIHHCGVVVKYHDSEGKKMMACIDPIFVDPRMNFKSSDIETVSEGGTCDWFATKRLEAIGNLNYLLKMQMTGKSKMILKGKGSSHTPPLLGIDLLRGTIYLNKAGSELFKELPLNRELKFSIQLADLKNPLASGVYLINGEECQMIHRTALKRFVDIVKLELRLPDDFEENIITLALNEEEIVTQILLPPVKTIRTTIKVVTEAFKSLQEVKDKQRSYRFQPDNASVTIKKILLDYENTYKQMADLFLNLQKAILANQSDTVFKLAADMMALQVQLTLLSQRIDNPVEVKKRPTDRIPPCS